MTGGTSGLGRVAAERIAGSGARLVLGARDPGRAPGGADALPLELGRLDSVRAFADVAGAGAVDALVLNAGVAYPHADARTADGFETTFAVNHLAHYLLVRLLLPRLARDARVILTSSGTHDPELRTLVPPPRHADAALLAQPDRDPGRHAKRRAAGGHAYTASKLCAVLTARALAARPEVRSRGIRALAFDPGVTPGTGLSRHEPAAVRAAWRVLGGPLRPLLPRAGSPAAAGGALARLALGEEPLGGDYAQVRRGRLVWRAPSALARRDDAAAALWRDSARLAGLPA